MSTLWQQFLIPCSTGNGDRHLLLVGGGNAQLLAPFFDGGWSAVLAEHDVDRLLADQLWRERDVLERMILAGQAEPARET